MSFQYVSFSSFLPTALQLDIKTFRKALYGESHEKVAEMLSIH